MKKDFLRMLACPKCHGALKQQKKQLICQHDKLVFPIENNIPVLLLEKATPLKEHE